MGGHLEPLGWRAGAVAFDSNIHWFVRRDAGDFHHLQTLDMLEASGVAEEVISPCFPPAYFGSAGWLGLRSPGELGSVPGVVPASCLEFLLAGNSWARH